LSWAGKEGERKEGRKEGREGGERKGGREEVGKEREEGRGSLKYSYI
jgi:hypothetical protein